MYNNLLNKKDITKLDVINEAAVDYNDTLLGAVTSGIGNVLSFFKGSIKKGISMQRVKALSKQWSTEYARAVMEVYKEINGEVTIKHTDDNATHSDIKLKPENVKKLINELTNLTSILDSTKKWQFNKLDLMSNEYEIFYKKLQQININYLEINELTSLINDHDYLSELPDLIKKLKEIIQLFLFSSDVKEVISKAGNISNISNKIKEAYKLIESIKSGYELVLNELNELNNVSESIILEKEYKLSKSITKLVTPDILNELEEIPDIKKKTTKKLNFETLNTIMYQVNHVIEKQKKKKGGGEVDVTKLQHYWDTNYQETNNYFQNVIDINIVKTQVTGKTNNPMEVDKVKQLDKELDNLTKLGLTTVVENGHKFNNKKLYCFVGQLRTFDNKERKLNLVLSPISKYIDKHEDKKLFWFKLFGAYDIDKNGNIIRKNPFTKLTTNKYLLEAGENINGHFYIAFDSAITVGKPRVLYIYDAKTGVSYFNNSRVKDIEKIKNIIIDIAKNNKKISNVIKELSIPMNILKLNINQRFDIDNDYLLSGKYPGIKVSDVEIDKNIEKAQKLHNNIMLVIKNNIKK